MTIDTRDLTSSAAEIFARHGATWRVILAQVDEAARRELSREVLAEYEGRGAFDDAIDAYWAACNTLRGRMADLVDERGKFAPTLVLSVEEFDGDRWLDSYDSEVYGPADLANDEAADASAA
jgi:NAD(P)-dependent dehydrogenase (short-subunit alcohol dehydrogenase family)